MWLNDSATVTARIFLCAPPSLRFKDPMGVVPVASHSYLEWNGAEPCRAMLNCAMLQCYKEGPCCTSQCYSSMAAITSRSRCEGTKELCHPSQLWVAYRRTSDKIIFGIFSCLFFSGKDVHIQTAAESSCIQCLSKLRYDTEAMRPTSRASWLRTVVVSWFIAIYGQAHGGKFPSIP